MGIPALFCFCMINIPICVLSTPRRHWHGDILSTYFYCEDAGIRFIVCAFSAVGALFGAIHCLAWNFSFPSSDDQYFWRHASLGVVVSCIVALRAALHRPDFIHLSSFSERYCSLVTQFLFFIDFSIVAFACFIYEMARIALFVLAIASLRSLPPSAFDTVDWIDFVPHI